MRTASARSSGARGGPNTSADEPVDSESCSSIHGTAGAARASSAAIRAARSRRSVRSSAASWPAVTSRRSNRARTTSAIRATSKPSCLTGGSSKLGELCDAPLMQSVIAWAAQSAPSPILAAVSSRMASNCTAKSARKGSIQSSNSCRRKASAAGANGSASATSSLDSSGPTAQIASRERAAARGSVSSIASGCGPTNVSRSSSNHSAP